MDEAARRREEILRRMQSDPMSQLILARVAHRPKAMALPTPAAGGEILRTVVTARMSPVEKASAPSQTALMTPVEGRLVRAGEANLNGAFFAEEDLEYGLRSLAGAPLTWNHISPRGAYGYIDSATLQASPEHGTHTHITGKVWTARFPSIGASLTDALASATASLSMECMATSVVCMAEGCGCETADADSACDHILEMSAARRMKLPTFYGAGLILDGVKPGWPGASLRIPE